MQPSNLGLTDYPEYYPIQKDTILKIHSSPKRVIVLKAPTGSGKTLTYVSAGLLSGSRCLYLTPTKALQAQVARTSRAIQIKSIDGHSSYSCYSTALGDEGCKDYSDCIYNSHVEESLSLDHVVTNPAHWCALASTNPFKLGDFQQLVIDEAHKIHDIVCESITIDLNLRFITQELRLKLPRIQTLESLRSWVNENYGRIRITLENEKFKINQFKFLSDLRRLKSIDLDNWKIIHDFPGEGNSNNTSSSLSIKCVWGKSYIEPILFREVPRIIIASATISQGTIEDLGLNSKEIELIDLPSTFPAENRPFIFVTNPPLIRLNYRTPEIHKIELIKRIDKIISIHIKQKGIIHSGSYERSRLIQAVSKYAEMIMFYVSSEDLKKLMPLFFQSLPPKVLCGPSLTEGYDFKEKLAEYGIILKVPFLNKHESPIIKARLESNPDYGNFKVVETIEQMYGRLPRGATEKKKSYILDAHWLDFVKSHGKKFDAWFRQAWKHQEI